MNSTNSSILVGFGCCFQAKFGGGKRFFCKREKKGKKRKTTSARAEVVSFLNLFSLKFCHAHIFPLEEFHGKFPEKAGKDGGIILLFELTIGEIGADNGGKAFHGNAVIDEAIRSLREISNNLSPHVLNNFGLARGIKNFVDRTATLHDVKISYSTELRNERFDSNVEVIIYRVICELVNNSLKHSACSNIEMSLVEESGLLVLDYSDNGKGFVLRDVEYSGMGLSNIRSRVSSLKGKVAITSRPNEGMSVKVRVSVSGAEIPDTTNLEPTNRKKRNRRNGRKNH